jgi:hypothetical protein
MPGIDAGRFIFGEEHLRLTPVFGGRAATLSFGSVGQAGSLVPRIEVKFDFTDSLQEAPVTIFHLTAKVAQCHRDDCAPAYHDIVIIYPESHYTLHARRRALFKACGIKLNYSESPLADDCAHFWLGWEYIG